MEDKTYLNEDIGEYLRCGCEKSAEPVRIRKAPALARGASNARTPKQEFRVRCLSCP